MKTNNYHYEDRQNMKIAKLLKLDYSPNNKASHRFTDNMSTNLHSKQTSQITHNMPYADVQSEYKSTINNNKSGIPAHLRPINYEERQKYIMQSI